MESPTPVSGVELPPIQSLKLVARGTPGSVERTTRWELHGYRRTPARKQPGLGR